MGWGNRHRKPLDKKLVEETIQLEIPQRVVKITASPALISLIRSRNTVLRRTDNGQSTTL